MNASISRHHYEEDSDGSQHGRKNTFSWSSISSSTTLQSTHSVEEEEVSVLGDFRFLDTPKKIERLTAILSRAASHGDLSTLRQIITDARLSPYISLDASDDEDGSTPLIYASCFGKLQAVQFLLQVGAKVDVQDKSKCFALNKMP